MLEVEKGKKEIRKITKAMKAVRKAQKDRRPMKILELARRMKGLSQAALAKELMYSRSHIGRIENQFVTPQEVHPRLRKALETYFGKTLEDLLTNAEFSTTCMVLSR